MGIVPRKEHIAAAQAAQRKWKLWASLQLAQAIGESSDGKFEPPGSNNPFGIQRLPGLPFVSCQSHEYREGKLVPVVEQFAKFASEAQAFDKHAELLATSSDYKYVMMASNPDDAARGLTKYSSTPKYDEIMIRIMKENNLYAYDLTEEELAVHAATPSTAPPPDTKPLAVVADAPKVLPPQPAELPSEPRATPIVLEELEEKIEEAVKEAVEEARSEGNSLSTLMASIPEKL